MKVTLEKAKEEDLEEIIKIQKEAFYDDYVKYGVCPAYTESLEGLKEYLDSNQLIYLIKIGEEIVGDVIINISKEDYYDLEVVCVKNKYQGRGIGKTTFDILEEKHKDKSWVLHTPMDKIGNHRFYEKIGYKNISNIKISDKLFMTKFIKNSKKS